MVVVADTGPLRYLILIDRAHVLPELYGDVVVPPAVMEELTNPRTPAAVRRWLADTPAWLRVVDAAEPLPHLEPVLDAGERDAIALALQLKADALLIDERDGRRAAQALGCPVIGTLRVRADAADQGLTDLEDAIARLTATNFRADARLMAHILQRTKGAD